MERRRIPSIWIIIYVIITAIEAKVTCTVDDNSYLCKNIANKSDVPHSLPSNIRKVTLIGTEEFKEHFPIALFYNETWANVSELSILKFPDVNFVPSGFLYGLEHLQFLSISSCPQLSHIDPDLFHNTPDLLALHLDENPRLEISSVEAALTGKVSKLKYISLIAIQARKDSTVLGVNFSKALQGKRLTYLDISRSNIRSIVPGLYDEILSTLKYINVSYSSFVMLGLSLTSYSVSSLELLDASGCRTLEEEVFYNKNNTEKCQFPPKLKYLYLKNIADVSDGLTLESTYNFQQCENKEFILLDFSKNDITILNITISVELYFHAIQILDLNSNNMEYISPSFLGRFPSLTILDLSKNQLHKMQNMDDFVNIFSRNKDLEILFLRSNSLSVLPENIFSSNIKLLVLDLSDNELTHLNCEWHNMQDLKMIDLRKNRLKYLPTPFVEQLENIFRHQATASKQNTTMTERLLSQFLDKYILAEMYRYGCNSDKKEQLPEKSGIVPPYLTIKLSEYPLLCDCDTLDFLQWIVTTNISIVDRTSLLCNDGNHEIVLNYKSFETVRQNCRLPVIISTAIASSVVIILCLFTVAIISHHRQEMARRHQDIRNLKKNNCEGHPKLQICSISSIL